MPTTKQFHLGDVLSITTSRLVSPRHMEGIYDILDFMTGAGLFTHQLPSAADECRPELFKQHPQLADVVVPEKFGADDVDAWLATEVVVYGEYLEIAPLPTARSYDDPIADLIDMGVEPEKIIVVEPTVPSSN